MSQNREDIWQEIVVNQMDSCPNFFSHHVIVSEMGIFFSHTGIPEVTFVTDSVETVVILNV